MNVGKEMQTDKRPRFSSQINSILYVFPVLRNIFQYLRGRRMAEIQLMTKRRKSLIFLIPCIFNIFPKCNQQDATFHNLFISIKRSTWFSRVFRPSSGAQTEHTVSGIVKLCCYLLLSWLGWNSVCCYHGWDGTLWSRWSSIPTMIAAGSNKFWQIPEAVCIVWSPDDGRWNRPKHVERFIEIHKLRNVSSFWLNFGNRRKSILTKNRDPVLRPATSHFIDSNIMNIYLPIRISEVLTLVSWSL
jgi:hypothetical protein